MKRGTYVSRSTYQKLKEQNKKLLRDIKILTGDLTPERVFLSAKWKKKFQDQAKVDGWIKEMLTEIKEHEKNQPPVTGAL